MTERAYLALGGNLGDVPAAFDAAICELEHSGVAVLRRSALLRSAPVDCPPLTPDFTNGVIEIATDLSPEELLRLCQRIEVKLGRSPDHGRNLSRTIDIDIILFGTRRISLPHLVIPHPRAGVRDFVTRPLAELGVDLRNLTEPEASAETTSGR